MIKDKEKEEKVQPKVEAMAPENGEKKAVPKKIKKTPDIHPINWVVLLLLAIGVVYTGFATQKALTGPVADVAVTTPAPTIAPALVLKLNQNHQRSAPAVQVNQNEIGRNNPLVKP
jgi:outer membrane biosynthesis protein TonB